MALTAAERQKRYREKNRNRTHDNCLECGKEKMNWAKVCVSCTQKKLIGDKNSIWKGDKVGYRVLHLWVERYLGKPRFCEECRSSNLKPRQYQWANISKKYKRDLNDWIRLCTKCHTDFDKDTRRGRRSEYKLTELSKQIMTGEIQ